MELTADRGLCIGAGMCVMTAPEVFDQDDDGIVVLMAEDIDADGADAVRQAVGLCPSGALRSLQD